MRPIDADSLIEHMRKAYNKRISDWDLISTVAVIGAEEDAKPTRHGYWIPVNPDVYGAEYFECSVCGMYSRDGLFRKELGYEYCPNCGALMGRGEEDEKNM